MPSRRASYKPGIISPSRPRTAMSGAPSSPPAPAPPDHNERQSPDANGVNVYDGNLSQMPYSWLFNMSPASVRITAVRIPHPPAAPRPLRAYAVSYQDTPGGGGVIAQLGVLYKECPHLFQPHPVMDSDCEEPAPARPSATASFGRLLIEAMSLVSRMPFIPSRLAVR